ALTQTSAPLLTSASAMARPMPAVLPVTRATLPFKSIGKPIVAGFEFKRKAGSMKRIIENVGRANFVPHPATPLSQSGEEEPGSMWRSRQSPFRDPPSAMNLTLSNPSPRVTVSLLRQDL